MILNTVAFLLQVAAAVPAPEARLLRDARSAQVRFETVRRVHLPRDRMGGSAGRCDAQIGRYCYWYDSTATSVVPEPQRIAEARQRLLRFLDSAAAINPADAWIAGQRVRYLLEAGLTNEAVAAALSCRALPWWCQALEGLALHVSQQYAAADSVFARALSDMPESQRCEWRDVSHVIGGRLERELARSDCAERTLLTDRLWTLSQPLWSTRGNDLRTEHYSRLTMAAILAPSANAHGMSWGDDSRELLLRYGWAESYTRNSPTWGSELHSRSGVLGRDREPSYYFFLDATSIREVPRVTSASWRLRDPAARTRYAPRHIKRMIELPHQLARFPRGDSMLVAVAFAIADTAMLGDSLTARLAAYQHATLDVSNASSLRTLTAMVAMDTLVASIEVSGAQSHHAARARYTVDPLECTLWCVSDLLLFDVVSGNSGDSLELALPHALKSRTLSVRRPLGVLWEIHAPLAKPAPSRSLRVGAASANVLGTTSHGASPAWVTLTVEPVRVSVARRVATRLRLADKPASLRLRWQTVIREPQLSQSVALRLPPKARGRYRLTVAIHPAGAPAALTSSREIELTP